MPLDSNGFRGAVLLTAGTYNIAGQLRISASGVVLRGAGQGPTGTELYDVGTTMRDLVLAQPSTDYAYREVSGTRQQVTDSYVPVGATSFDVASTAGYHVGDKIIVNKPSTVAWITAIGMDASQMGTEAWTPSSSFIQQDRTITAINGNRITIDIPIGTSMDLSNGYGGGSIFKYTTGRISNVGVEDIRFDSNYVDPEDVNHAGRPVTFDGVSNGWIRQITSLHYQNGPIMDTSSEFITVEDTAFLDPISQPHLGGDAMNAELTLYQRNYVRNCHCDFVTQSAAPGPSVFVFCRGENSVQSTGPHQRWATATLFDNVKINGAGIELINRNTMGSGQGWAGANMVTWNCRSDWSDVESPPTAQNWAIGAVAPIRRNKYGPEGIYDSFGTPVAIHSLYIAQLKQAMGPPKPVTDTYSFSVGDNDNFVYNGASDMPYIDPDWKAIVESDMPGTGTVIGFDDPTPGRRRAATILCNLNLAPHEELVGATLTMKLKPISDLTTNDSLFLDSPGASFDYDMLGLLPWSAGQVKTITLDLTDIYGPLLEPLQDGKFNIMMNGNMNVDSIQLNLGTAIPLVEWKGGSGNNWATSANWTSTIGVPDNIAAKVVFGNQASANSVVDINSPGRTVGCITFAPTTSTTIQSSGGYSLTLDNNGKAAVIDVSGSHIISAPVVLNNDVNIIGFGALRISGRISGSHNLNLSGGNLTLAGNNTFSGATTINAGSLALDSSGAINSTSGITVGSGTLLQVTGGSSGQLPDSGNVTLNGGSINFIGNGSLSAGELAGTLVLNPGQNNITTSNSGGANPYLCFAGGPASHTIGATVNFYSTNSQIQFQANPPDLTNGILGGYAFYNNVDFAARTTTAPYVIQQYTGYLSTDPGGSQSASANLRPNSTITVSSNKSFNSLSLTGNYGVILSGGSTLTLNSGGLIANTTGSISSGGTLNGSPGGELVINTVQDFTVNCPIANNGAATALVKTGAGKLKLTGLNTFTGNTYLNQGTLEYAPASDLTYGGVISGVGNLLKTGASTLTLTGSNTYSGTTTISAGRLQVNGSLDFDCLVTVGGGTLGGTGTVNGDTILNNGAIDLATNGCLAGSLTSNGGSWIGVGSVAGKTTVASGTLTIGNVSQAGNLTANGGLEVTGSATLATGNSGATITGDFIYSSSANLNFSGIIAGTGNSVTMNNSSSTLTLSSANTYSGLTNIVAGTLKAGNANALGGTAAGGTFIYGGTLDVNGQNLTTEPITVQGAGVGGNGAIINSGAQQINALKAVTLSGDATFGGTQTPPGGTGFGRWDIRGTSASLSTGGTAYNLTKVGANQVSFVATTVDTALGDININQGFLGFQTSTNGMGDPNKTVTIASGAALEFYSTTNAMNKKCVLGGGTIWGESGSGTQNTFSGPITVNGAGGVFDAGGGLTGGAAKSSAVLTISGTISGAGGVTKNGPGTVFITGTPGYLGDTAISAGTLQINSGAAVTLHAISGAGALGINNTTSLTAGSISIGILTIGAGSTITITPMPGGPLADLISTQSVPEPAITAMLLTAGLAGLLLGIRRLRR
jgi:autotransporter-associated beta strand protein